MPHITVTENIEEKGNWDVIVCGGGVAGVAAAISARRNGKRVLLLDRNVVLGGLATIGLINFFVPLCNGRGKQIIFGMAEEFLKLSIQHSYDTIPDDWKNGEPSTPTSQRYITYYSPQIFALELTELLTREGVDVWFDTQLLQPIMNDGHCMGVVVQNKSGKSFLRAKVFVDATGDTDLFFQAGAPTRQGKNYYTYFPHTVTVETCAKVAETRDMRYLRGGNICGGRASLHGDNHPKDMKTYKGTEGVENSEFLISNQRLLLENLSKTPRSERDVITLPTMAQFRTTRCIVGDYTFLETDHYQHFSDSVGAICDFERRDYLYEVPYRAMIDSKFDNLIAAGRCVSAEGYGWDLLRVIPPAILTGQVAGIAASQAIDGKRHIAKLPIADLQSAVAAAGVKLHFDDTLVPEGGKEQADTIADIGHL